VTPISASPAVALMLSYEHIYFGTSNFANYGVVEATNEFCLTHDSKEVERDRLRRERARTEDNVRYFSHI
jgi:hypothetical protein